MRRATLRLLVIVVGFGFAGQIRAADKYAKAEALRRQIAAIYEQLPVEATMEQKDKATQDVMQLLSTREKETSDVEELIAIAQEASFFFEQGGPELSLAACRKAVKLHPSDGNANIALAERLKNRTQNAISEDQGKIAAQAGSTTADFDRPRVARRSAFVEAEKYARRGLELKAKPECSDYLTLADILDQLDGNESETLAVSRRALNAGRRDGDSVCAAMALRSLWPRALNMGDRQKAKEYFADLMAISPDAIGAYVFGLRLHDEKDFGGAAEAFLTACRIDQKSAAFRSSAARDLLLANREDDALAAAREGLQLAGDGDSRVRSDCARIASDILNPRGLHEEALKYADLALAADPKDAFNHVSRASALNSLHRNAEALTAAKEAVRLTDGKFAYMHFLVGNIYFDMSAWDDAEAAFERAANLDKTDAASTFNIALCYLNKGYSADAITWYEETLRRNPNHPKREQILRNIARLKASK